MAIRRRSRIVDRDGAFGRLQGVDMEDGKHPIAVVQLLGGGRVRIPFELLEQHHDGGYTLPARWSDFMVATETTASIPVIAERVKVEVRPAPAQRVRVRRRVVSETRLVEVPVWHERVQIEHVPRDVLVDRHPEARREGDTLIVPCVEEVVIVEKRLRIREELRIRVVRERRVHRENVVVRRHEVETERSNPTIPEDLEGDEP